MLVRVIPAKATGDLLTRRDVNWQGVQMSRALDGRGCRATPLGKITIAGAEGLEIGGTSRLRYERRKLTRVLGAQPMSDVTVAARWIPIGPGAEVGQWNAASNNVCTLFVPLGETVPHGATIDSFIVYINPTDAVHGALPSTMPTAAIVSTLLSTGANTTHHTATDASASVAAYEAFHAISASNLSIQLDKLRRRYTLVVTSEGGGDPTTAGTNYVGATVTFWTAAADDGAA